MNLHDILQNAEYYVITEYSVLFCYSADYSVVLVQNIGLRPNIENPVSVEPYKRLHAEARVTTERQRRSVPKKIPLLLNSSYLIYPVRLLVIRGVHFVSLPQILGRLLLPESPTNIDFL